MLAHLNDLIKVALVREGGMVKKQSKENIVLHRKSLEYSNSLSCLIQQRNHKIMPGVNDYFGQPINADIT